MKERIQRLMQKLINQYNSQNDTIKPRCTEKYDYKLTESEFDLIQTALKLKADKEL